MSDEIRKLSPKAIIEGNKIPPRTPKINWLDQGQQALDFKKKHSPYVVLNPGSNEYGRRWPIQNYLSLTRYLIEMGLSIIIVGGRDERIDNLPNYLGVIMEQ